MKLQPIVYTTDVEKAVAWYSKLLARSPVYSSDVWTAFAVGGATLGVHHVAEHAAGSNVGLSLIAEEALEAVIDRLRAAGISADGPIEDQPFGRSVLYRDLDGRPIQVNEHHA